MKIKQVLPSLKENKRYVAFKIVSESKITDLNQLYDKIKQFLGELTLNC